MTAADLLVSLAAVAGFALGLWATRVAATTQRAVRASSGGVLAMLDPELGDDVKEVAVRRAGLAVILAGLDLLWRLVVALVAAAVPVLLADRLGWVVADDVFALMLRLDWIVVVNLAAIAVAAVVRRLRQASPAAPVAGDDGDEEERYSPAEQLLHAVAFAGPRVLPRVSRLEDRLLRSSADEPAAPPVFVTSLARAGTTALLNALAEVPGVATHTYRDMPFLTAPTLWNRVAGGRLRSVEQRERAHGDGLEIGLDSPEAFEEVLWRLHWPAKYRGGAIALWRPDERDDEADAFLAHHMAKVVHARRVQAPAGASLPVRYLSKNNANVARLAYLRAAFPDCRVVVPFRRPESHAASMRRQHHNFLAQHAADPFTRRYMRDLGHLEFGDLHTPMAFPGFDPQRHPVDGHDYWLHYWVAAFREVLRHADEVVLVGQDALRAAPEATMAALCAAIDLDPGGVRFADQFHSRPDHAPTDLYDPALYAEATEVYDRLVALGVGARDVAPVDPLGA